MNTLIWIGIVLIAWNRPIDAYYKTQNYIFKDDREYDWVKIGAYIAAFIFIYYGIYQ